MSGRRVVGARFHVFGIPKAWKFIGVKLTPLLFMRRKISQYFRLDSDADDPDKRAAAQSTVPRRARLPDHGPDGRGLLAIRVASNRHALETFVRYMHEQGLVPEPM